MATYTPPPDNPQGSLAPADKSRNRKYKLVMRALAQMLSLITMNLDLSRRLLAEGQFSQVQTEIDEMQKLARQANREGF